MKITFTILLIIATCALLCAQNAAFQSPAALPPVVKESGKVQLAWTSTNISRISGFRVYHGTNASMLNRVFPVGKNTSATVDNLTPWTTWHFAVVSVGTNGIESSLTNTVTSFITNVYVGPVMDIRATAYAVSVTALPRSTNVFQDAPSPAGPWRNVATNVNAAATPAVLSVVVTNNSGQRYFRAMKR